MKKLLTRFDLYWTDVIQDLPTALAPVMKAATTVGQPVAIGGFLMLCSIASHLQGVSDHAIAYSVALVSVPLASLIKVWVRRQRPQGYTRHRWPSHSFPSGHAYGTTLALGVAAGLNASLALFVLTLGMAGLVGISRIYRGAHFPSDVVGGWLIAGMIAVAIVGWFA